MPRIAWCRALAVLGAYLLALQSAGLPLLLAEAPASCCCAQRDMAQKCGCTACTHAREVESGQPVLKTCGRAEQASLAPSLDVALPAAAPRALRTPRAAALAEPPPLQDGPQREVHKPPPLALS